MKSSDFQRFAMLLLAKSAHSLQDAARASIRQTVALNRVTGSLGALLIPAFRRFRNHFNLKYGFVTQGV